MRLILALLILIAVSFPVPPTRAQGCTETFVTVETVYGTIAEIVPAPEPFVSADIRLVGPAKCTPLWMQVLKSEAASCRVGDRVQAHGIVVSDPETESWTINPVAKMYMILGQDYSCTR